MGATGLIAGPNFLAPQSTPQSDHQFTIRWQQSHPLARDSLRGLIQPHSGGGFAVILQNGFRLFRGMTTNDIAAAATVPFRPAFPIRITILLTLLRWPMVWAIPLRRHALGFPAGGIGPDNRVPLYLGDSWKVKPNISLTYGLRYDRDTGRTDSQFPPIPGLNALFPGLGDSVNQPNSNLAPQLGFAWDPTKSGKTSIRGGIGLFYENAVWNNVLFDGPFGEGSGAFLQSFAACASPGSPTTLQTVNGPINTPGSPLATAVCGPAGASSFPLIGTALPSIIALQQAYVAGSPFNIHAPNPSYIPARPRGLPLWRRCFHKWNAMFIPAGARSV